MRHHIDPKVDCVFKALLGAEQNRNLLIHFLNAMLVEELMAPIVDVEILDPYNAMEFIDDKLSIVDVKARDTAGQLYQIEIQLATFGSLPARMLYTWADIYSKQLQSGQDYRALRPTYSIWLLGQTLFPQDEDYARDFKPRDLAGRVLVTHGGIWVFELTKLEVTEVRDERTRWLKLFKEGETLDDAALPKWMHTDEMRQAMSTLRGFSEKERAYHAYQARQNYLREQSAIRGEIDELKREAEEERRKVEEERCRAEDEKRRAEDEKRRAEDEKRRAEDEKRRAEDEKRRAEDEKRRAEDEKRRADQEMRAREEAERMIEKSEQERDAAVAEVARLTALLEQKKRDET